MSTGRIFDRAYGWQTLSGPFIPAADARFGLFGLTNILRTCQHTLATSASTCEILTAFLFKEQLSNDDESIRTSASFSPAPRFRSSASNSPPEPARSCANPPHRIERLRENYFGFRSANLP